jgi:hypothetical protein
MSDKIFGVDFENDEVVLFSGQRLPVVNWYDFKSNECSKDKADALVFQTPAPDSHWIGLIIDHVTTSEVWH